MSFAEKWRKRHLADLLTKCESPIERQLCEYLYTIGNIGALSLAVMPQQEISPFRGERPYRVDFLLVMHYRGETATLVVECDGHEFHEKTKEQAQHDKVRDRMLSLWGYDVIHFTGSEIYNNPEECAMETLVHMQTAIGRKRGTIREPQAQYQHRGIS